jgi:broad specificity phosphatase PhoE
MTRALFLRHGESAHNAHGGPEPLPDSDGDRLTKRGLEQARAAGTGLAEFGITRLLTSPMRRTRETAEAIGTAIGLDPVELPGAHELRGEETFEMAIARVHALKGELERGEAGDRPLLVTHGIFTRFFLLDSVLGKEFRAEMAGRIWQLASHNCGLTVFAHGESRDPAGNPVPGWTCLTWMERPWDRP